MAFQSNLREFPGLSHVVFQHPADKQALEKLKRIPLLPRMTKKFSEAVGERFVRIHSISSRLRVTSRQYPDLHSKYVRIAQVLDVRRLPDLYISTDPDINAYAMGMEDYFIVVNSGLIDLLEEDELLAVIGHELGHVKCEHMLYVTMANTIRLFGATILEEFVPGVGQLASVGAQLALLEWYRKAEFSCDRSALLAVQDCDVVCSMLAKLAGFSKNLDDTFNIEAVRRQAEDYQDIGADSLFDKIIKVYLLLGETHPYPVVRANEIGRWAESTEYEQILKGQYKALAEMTSQAEKLPTPTLETPTGLVCPRCKAVWPASSSFCGKCRANLRTAQTICGRCHNFVDPEWIVCSSCGYKLKTNT